MLKAGEVTHKVPHCMAFLICALKRVTSEDQKNTTLGICTCCRFKRMHLWRSSPAALAELADTTNALAKSTGRPSVRALLKRNAQKSCETAAMSYFAGPKYSLALA
jgi:hypothetical protein